MTDMYEMERSVTEWLKMVETKMLVDKWMLLRTKIIPTIWHHGGWLQTRQVQILCQWEAQIWLDQALSTLQQLKEEEAQRNQRWAQSSSPSSWSWQGSWWTPLILWKSPWRWTKYWLNRATCYTSNWNNSSRYDSQNSCFLLQNDVYSWRWSTVTDDVCKYHTSNDVFPRCKSVHKMATGNCDEALIQPDNKMRIGTRSGKFIIVDWTWSLGDKAWRRRQWQHLWLRGTAWRWRQW